MPIQQATDQGRLHRIANESELRMNKNILTAVNERSHKSQQIPLVLDVDVLFRPFGIKLY